MGKFLLFTFWGIVAIFLAWASITSESSSAILAEVESQRYAISFPKAVRVKEFYVVPGQKIEKGDPLIRVERPDLLLDMDNKLQKLTLLRSNLEKKRMQKENQLNLNDIQIALKENELENQIRKVSIAIEDYQELSGELSKLNYMNTDHRSDSILEKRLELLKKERRSLKQEHYIRAQEIKSIFSLEESSIQAEIELLQKEADLLRQEEDELIQYARVDGTIGNIYVETEELAPPYTNLVSVYEDNPTVIRAFTNERDVINIESGTEVYVESTNRQYRISGKVIEVGSRIIEYPERLRTFDQKPTWGREMFIKIPEESRFLNGEKVFVILR